jgi:DNA polymerase III subunit delta
MISKHYEIEKFKEKINFYLFYGENEGLIKDTIDLNFKKYLNNNLYKYSETELLNNKNNLFDDIFSKSFFNNEKLILVLDTTDKSTNLVDKLLEHQPEDTKFIFLSNRLDKKSKIRKLFEKNVETLSVPFFEDNYQTLNLITQKFFKEKKINISQQIINLIIDKSKGKRINLKNELNKLDSFCQNKKKIEEEDVLKLIKLSQNFEISELVDQCLLKNKKRTINILNENNSSTEDNIMIVKTFLYKLKRLKTLRLNLKIDKNLETVISNYKPPIFWKDKETIKYQLKIWPLSKIKLLIKKINDLELLIKKNHLISNQIISDFVLEQLEIPNN